MDLVGLNVVQHGNLCVCECVFVFQHLNGFTKYHLIMWWGCGSWFGRTGGDFTLCWATSEARVKFDCL